MGTIFSLTLEDLEDQSALGELITALCVDQWRAHFQNFWPGMGSMGTAPLGGTKARQRPTILFPSLSQPPHLLCPP